jgi:hypothetical protein
MISDAISVLGLPKPTLSMKTTFGAGHHSSDVVSRPMPFSISLNR